MCHRARYSRYCTLLYYRYLGMSRPSQHVCNVRGRGGEVEGEKYQVAGSKLAHTCTPGMVFYVLPVRDLFSWSSLGGHYSYISPRDSELLYVQLYPQSTDTGFPDAGSYLRKGGPVHLFRISCKFSATFPALMHVL